MRVHPTPCSPRLGQHHLPRLATAALAWAALTTGACLPALGQAQAIAAAPQAAAIDGPTTNTPPLMRRPRIGLVLSGGGARGLSHVGVLKVLERERIPVDVIAGTSMGAIIGGLYASGMSAAELETELLQVNWDTVFASRVSRRHLSQRRKEEDFEVSPLLEIGMRDGEFRAPLSAISGRGLEALLRRYTLPVRQVHRFDDLSIPFRAVATHMETGQPVVLSEGDLALALRSSMSVPGVFAPTVVNGQVLGDGGLVNNVPMDVARAMGADVLIVVNIGTPLSGEEALHSVTGITGQMINILTEQNVQRSLSTLGPRDVLVSPRLGDLTSGDFAKTAELIHLGEQGALARAPQLGWLAMSPADYAAWHARRARPVQGPVIIGRIEFRGSAITNPARFAAQLESRVGLPFDAAAAARDARLLAASGDYVRTDHQLVRTETQGAAHNTSNDAETDTLVFELEDKPWGPHYFNLGIDLGTDFNGNSSFNLKISHNRHWLTPNGSEWRNLVQIGEVPRVFSELYHPLNWTTGLSNDWFVAGHGEAHHRRMAVYNSTSGEETGRFMRTLGRVGLDLGQRWGELGALRLGLTHSLLRSAPEIISVDYTGPTATHTVRETGARLGVVIDQLDYANFPLDGYRIKADLVTGRQRDTATGPPPQNFTTIEAEGSLVRSIGEHTLNAHLRFAQLDQAALPGQGRYTLGGFHQMSGYLPGQIEGNTLLFGRLRYYRRLPYVPTFARAIFVGSSLEVGNAWATRGQLSLNDLRLGSSLYVGTDTGLGPLHLGTTYSAFNGWGVYLFIGKL